jgi:hypothetical protein
VALDFVHVPQCRCFKRSAVTFVYYINKYKLGNNLGGHVEIKLDFVL